VQWTGWSLFSQGLIASTNYCLCVVDVETLLLPRMLYSFFLLFFLSFFLSFLFHFRTKFTLSSPSWKRGRSTWKLNTMCKMVSFRIPTVLFGNLTSDKKYIRFLYSSPTPLRSSQSACRWSRPGQPMDTYLVRAPSARGVHGQPQAVPLSHGVSGWNTAVTQSAECRCLQRSGPWTSGHPGTVPPLQRRVSPRKKL